MDYYTNSDDFNDFCFGHLSCDDYLDLMFQDDSHPDMSTLTDNDDDLPF